MITVPAGGCVKDTDGIYRQIFDSEGNIISSEFIQITARHMNEYGDELDEDDNRRKFEHPFAS